MSKRLQLDVKSFIGVHGRINEMTKLNPVWLHPDTPEYLAYYEAKIREECARFKQDIETITMSFEVSGEDRLMVEEAINRTMEFTGTSHSGIALEHICTAYLQNGPLAKATNRMDARHNARKVGLAELMKELGSKGTLEVYNAVFSNKTDVYGGVGEDQ